MVHHQSPGPSASASRTRITITRTRIRTSARTYAAKKMVQALPTVQKINNNEGALVATSESDLLNAKR